MNKIIEKDLLNEINSLYEVLRDFTFFKVFL